MASTSGSNMSSLQTPIFIGKNYEYWSLTMKYLFKVQDVWEIVEYGYATIKWHTTISHKLRKMP